MYPSTIAVKQTDNNNIEKKRREQKDRSHISILPGNPETYKCNICEKTFRNKKGKCYHDACVTGVKPYRCQICDQSFVKRSHFEYHERAHTGYKPFKCSLCDKAFPQKNKLNRHMNSHKHEKEFCCGKCGKRYRNKDDLRNHTSFHTGIRPHVCKFCDKSFRILTNLNRHARTHSNERPYVCGYCGKSFKDSSLLIRHKKIHGKERPFSCAHCNRAFLSKSELARHLVIHTDVKPFNCLYCSTIFRRKDNLARHIRHHHADNNEKTSSKSDDKIAKTNASTIVNDEDEESIDYEQRSDFPVRKNNRVKKSAKTLKTTINKVTMKKSPLPKFCGLGGSAIARITAGNSRDQINSRMDSLGNITPIIRGPAREFSNAVPVINGPIFGFNSNLERENGVTRVKKVYTYTEPIPMAEAVDINRRIEEKLYPQQGSIGGLANNYYIFRKMANSNDSVGSSNSNKIGEPTIINSPEISRNFERTEATHYSRSDSPWRNRISAINVNSEKRDVKNTNGKFCNGLDDLGKSNNRSVINNYCIDNEREIVKNETNNIHLHWRRRTAESLKSSHPD